VQGRVERSLFHLEHVIRVPFDGLGDGLSMGGSEAQRTKDQQVERALHELDAVIPRIALLSGRHPRCDDSDAHLECQGEK